MGDSTTTLSPPRKGSDTITLDDVLYAMEMRPEPSAAESGVFSGAPDSAGMNADEAELLAELQKKDRDLVLAAELGKALLDKNEELSRQNERMAEEYSAQLEELEQEKYHLRRRLDNAQEEYDLKVSELQHDLQSLQGQLDDASSAQRQSEKEKSLLITTLTEQNQRLTSQLKESAKQEESMTAELQQLREQVNSKRTSMNEHVSHLDMLREEITLMTERKLDLERRIDLLQGEREGLSSTLDESADRIIMLEKESREQDSLIRANEKAMSELQSTNQALQDRLESMYRSVSLSPHATSVGGPHSHNVAAFSGGQSLLNEMELSEDSERSLQAARRPFSQIDEEERIDEIECDNPEQINPLEMKELKSEILSAYQQLKSLSAQLRRRNDKTRRSSGDSLDDEGGSTSSSEEYTTVASVKTGLLPPTVQELRGLLHDLLRKEAKGACLSCGGDTNERLRLEVQLHKSTEAREKAERRMKVMTEEAKRKDEEILELKGKLSLIELKLGAAEEERDTLRDDAANTTAGKDELIKKAWEVRDAAVKRKNDTQIELARTRIDVMQVNSQLLEAIQQKVELSQQLDQWQGDMEELLEEQMMKKMRAHEVKSGNESDSSGVAAAERKKSKLLSFFQRS